MNVPVILHIRDAHADALTIMKDFPELKFVVHCFTGTPAECAAWIAIGAYIGITGIVTYKNAGDVKAAAKLVPPDRLLIETDAPYLSPEPVRKMKTNEPANVRHTAEFVANLRGVSFEQLAEETTRNAVAALRRGTDRMTPECYEQNPAAAVVLKGEPFDWECCMTTVTADESHDVKEQVAGFQKNYAAIEAEVGKMIVGHKEVVPCGKRSLCLMTGGHALLEGVPEPR